MERPFAPLYLGGEGCVTERSTVQTGTRCSFGGFRLREVESTEPTPSEASSRTYSNGAAHNAAYQLLSQNTVTTAVLLLFKHTHTQTDIPHFKRQTA
jgi:hypothetical protein